MPELSTVEHVSKNVWRVLGMNPGAHTLQGTNTWLVGNGPSKILIDTGEFGTSEKYVAYLLGTVFPLTNTTSISTILLTHGHADHMGGVQTLLSELKKIDQPMPKIYKRNIHNGKFPFQKFGCENILDGQCFDASRKKSGSGGSSDDNSKVVKEDEDEGDEVEVEEIILKALYTPGHTDDHVVFTLQEENTSALFSGDCVLGCGSAVFDDLHQYMASLNLLKSLMIENCDKKGREIITKIFPGHGPAINENSIDKIEEYITNRLKREEDILSFLQNVFLQNKFRDQNYGNCSVQNTETKSKISETEKTHKSVKESFMPNMKLFFRNENYKSSWEIMSKIYGKLPIFVKFSAQSNCLHHLEKLLKENKVSHKWPDLWAVNTHK